jgi:hypothetical protein
MRRREFITRLGAAGACGAVPRVARAQQDTRVRRLAVLVAGDELRRPPPMTPYSGVR